MYSANTIIMAIAGTAICAAFFMVYLFCKY
jgi:hypothetical protein